QQKIKKNHFEKLVRFDELTYELWGLYQQAVVGNINVPKRDYMDPRELSWMWSWIKGNKKWHAWNGWRGLASDEAKRLYIEKVTAIANDLPNLVEQWKDEMDPRVPDEKAWVPDEEKEERLRIIEKAKRERRIRDAIAAEEEAAMELRHAQRRAQGEPSDTEESETEDIDDTI
uniref:ACB domain-containing protein n=1 Tax=Plectus sambesii TaxID=2011161 RepID=A0A914XI40_9BILA